MRRIELRVPDHLYLPLEALARCRMVSVTSLLRTIILDSVERRFGKGCHLDPDRAWKYTGLSDAEVKAEVARHNAECERLQSESKGAA
jgi:hypothetical protein